MQRESFNKDWLFKAGKYSFFSQIRPPQNEEINRIQLPHDAMIHEMQTDDTPNGPQSGFYPGGQYIYKKKFDAPKEWEDGSVVVEFEGVYQTAMVYVNGSFACKNLYGYSQFHVELNPYLNFENTNEIMVIADNTAEPNSRWYSGSGIYRNVNLMIGGKIHIPVDGMKIRTVYASEESAIIEIETKIKNRTHKNAVVYVNAVIFEDEKTDSAGEDRAKLTLYPDEEETVRQTISIRNPKLWNCDTPNLYQCRVNIVCDGEILDVSKEYFGIRTITVEGTIGFRINGKSVKLRGTCIHHDNGIIGAATFEKAEERRCRQLKEAGFNSIRSAHHPMSRAMLNACDRLGMIVMDELSDIWMYHKNTQDFALHFDTNWEQEVERMVAKDYNHPSVVFYSTGNEIPEIGMDYGAKMNRKICNKLHVLDSSRFTTAGLNGLLALAFGGGLEEVALDIVKKQAAAAGEDAEQMDGGNALNSVMGSMDETTGNMFASHPILTERFEESSSALDVPGFNYLTGRHLLEHELNPNKAILGAETYPSEIVRLWKLVKQYPHIIGDYTWTGYDYLGEAGIGIFHYDGKPCFARVFPEKMAYIGDINIIGCRRPISYLREIVFGLRRQPYLAVERVERFGQPYSKTSWMFKDNISSWTWPGYEEKPARADIYADAQEVELFQNGKSLGRKPAGEKYEYTATYELTYEPGELVAVAYDDGVETGRFKLLTAGSNIHMQAEYDCTELLADGEDMAFITVKLVDENGFENMSAVKDITVKVEGAGTLQGFGSANPSVLTSYDDTTWTTYDGSVMAAVRSGTQCGKLKVTFTADGCDDCVVEIEVGKSI